MRYKTRSAWTLGVLVAISVGATASVADNAKQKVASRVNIDSVECETPADPIIGLTPGNIGAIVFSQHDGDEGTFVNIPKGYDCGKIKRLLKGSVSNLRLDIRDNHRFLNAYQVLNPPAPSKAAITTQDAKGLADTLTDEGDHHFPDSSNDANAPAAK